MKNLRFIALLAAVLMLVAIFPIAGQASTTTGARKVNVAIVMDGSGSLINGWQTDKEGNRYEAVSMFLDIMTESGNNVSAIVFNGNTSSDTSPEGMATGIALNTGLIPINSQADKELLKEQIRSARVGGYTDIGTALLTAAQTLEEQSAQNGLDSVLILFTDGSTELPTNAAYEQSIQNRNDAIVQLKDQGVTLFGLFLNHNGISPSTEVFEIVRDTNGFSPNATAEDLKERYFPVTSSDSLMDAFWAFYRYMMNGPDPLSFDKETDFRIPGIGVEDVNITVEAPASVLNQIKVTLTRPDGSVYTDQELAEILSRGNTYAVYKINAPTVGRWHVKIETPEDDTLLECNLIVNVSIGADIFTEPEPHGLHVNNIFEAFAHLSDEGVMVTDPAAYREYDCQLRLVEADSGKETLLNLAQDESGMFMTELKLDSYKTYYVNAVFSCGEAVVIPSPVQTWSLTNTTPEAESGRVLKPHISIFGSKPAQVDLAELVYDIEDGDDQLTYTLQRNDYPKEALTLDGTILSVDGKLGGQGTLQITFRDTQGAQATTELTVRPFSTVALEIALLVVVLLVLAGGGLFLLYKTKTGLNLEGQVELTLPLLTPDEEREVELTLSFDAYLAKNKTVYDLLTDQHTAFKRAVFDDYNLRDYADDVIANFMSRNKDELSAVKVSAVFGKKKAGQTDRPVLCRVKIAKCQMYPHGRTDVLGNGGRVALPMNNASNGQLKYLSPVADDDDDFGEW